MLKPYINGICAMCKYASTDMVCHYNEDAPIKDCCDIGECDVYKMGEYTEPTKKNTVYVEPQKSEELEQEPILDKIRAKIEKIKTTMNMFNREDTKQYVTAMEDVLKIIDEYKAESEGV